MKTHPIIIALLILIPGINLIAQDTIGGSQVDRVEGQAKNGTMSITFKNMVYNDIPVSGEIKPNLSSTTYSVNISGNENVLKGIIATKELKWIIDLDFNGEKISGEMKIPLTGENYKWDVNFLGNEITGGIKLNLTHTKSTVNLQSKNMVVTGELKEKLTSVGYNLKVNGKPIKGTIKSQVDGDLTYKLELDHLNQKEIAMFYLIETMRIIALNKEATDKFQNGD